MDVKVSSGGCCCSCHFFFFFFEHLHLDSSGVFWPKHFFFSSFIRKVPFHLSHFYTSPGPSVLPHENFCKSLKLLPDSYCTWDSSPLTLLNFRHDNSAAHIAHVTTPSVFKTFFFFLSELISTDQTNVNICWQNIKRCVGCHLNFFSKPELQFGIVR